MLLLPALSLRPSAETLLPAVSPCCCPQQMSPGLCCCWGSATGCWLPVSARQTCSPDASKAVSAKIRAAGCGPRRAMVACASPWGCVLPVWQCHGQGSCSLQGPGCCLSPHSGLCCLGDTQHTHGLNEIKQFVPLCDRLTGSLGAEWEEDEELNFLSVLSCPW